MREKRREGARKGGRESEGEREAYVFYMYTIYCIHSSLLFMIYTHLERPTHHGCPFVV